MNTLWTSGAYGTRFTLDTLRTSGTDGARFALNTLRTSGTYGTDGTNWSASPLRALSTLGANDTRSAQKGLIVATVAWTVVAAGRAVVITIILSIHKETSLHKLNILYNMNFLLKRSPTVKFKLVELCLLLERC